MSAFTPLTPEEKVQRVLEEIVDESKMTPKGQPLEIHRNHESDVSIGERHYQQIITKLEHEEKVIKILPDNREDGTYSTQWGYPSRFARMEIIDTERLAELLEEQRRITQLSSESLNFKVHKAATWWGMNKSERKIHTIVATDYAPPTLRTPQSKPISPFPVQMTNQQKAPELPKIINMPQPVAKSGLRIEFSDASGELILNDIFVLAKPTPNEQNYRIIRYLIANPNRFVTEQELKKNALEGKSLDKRLTDFVAQINLNKDLGKLFFDTSKDSIRLSNPVTTERMNEKNIRRIRIKPA